MIRILLLLSVIFMGSISASAQKRGQARIDSLLNEIQATKIDTQQARLLIDLSFTYSTIDPDKGISYGQDALRMSEGLGWKAGIADAYRAIGVNHGFGKSEFAESLAAFTKALEIAEETNDQAHAAKLLNNMGVVYWYLGDLPKAIEYYYQALRIHEAMENKEEMAISLTNIGIVYNSLGDYPKALEYLLKGNAIDEELGNTYGIASNLGNIGQIYAQMEDFPKALQYDSSALALYQQLGDKNGIARNLGNMGGIYSEMGLHRKALDHYFKALSTSKELGLQIGIAVNLGAIGSTYLKVAKADDPESLSAVAVRDNKQALHQARIYTDSAIVISKDIGDISTLIELYERLSEIHALSGDFHNALAAYKLHTMSKDSVFNMEKEKKLTEAAMQYEFDRKVALAKAEQEQKDIRQRAIRNAILAGLLVTLIFSGIVIRQWIRIGREKKISDAEKRRSDELLLNILPEEVANELKTTGTAKTKAFTMVTVMLTDFKDYTLVSEKVSGELLVAEIHHCFSAFDHIISKYKIEKIKTIGDAYLCASGIPVTNYSHATDIVKAAMEIRAFMQRRKLEKEALGQMPFDIRIGIHTGPVVAGIVGVKKYAYDIWGDTVNLAARMESRGEASKINISQSTYELVKDQFECTYRGKIEAKNKGMVNMYFVEPKEDEGLRMKDE